jgi:hypothetical protein
MTRNYGGLTYIAMGVGPDERFEQESRQEAARRGWKYERLEGQMGLIRQLVDGPWDADKFLVVPPGSRVASSFDEGIIKAV